MALLHAHAPAGGVTFVHVGISRTKQAQRRDQACHRDCQEQSKPQAQAKRLQCYSCNLARLVGVSLSTAAAPQSVSN